MSQTEFWITLWPFCWDMVLGTKVVQRQDKDIFETVQQLKRKSREERTNELASIKRMHANAMQK